MVRGYEDDPLALKLLAKLALSLDASKDYTLTDGVIRFRGRIWIGNNKLAQQPVLQALHTSGIGGHSGFHDTYHRVKSLFAWPQLKASIRNYVKCCTICQQAKVEHVKQPGLLEPLPVPSRPWTVICTDFIEGLPPSNKPNVIMVVIDKFTKYAHFMALYHPFTALQVAQVFLNVVYKLNGLPEAIVSD